MQKRSREEPFKFEFDIKPWKDFACFFVDQLVMNAEFLEFKFKETGETKIHLPSKINMTPMMLSEYLKSCRDHHELMEKVKRTHDRNLVADLFWIFSNGKSWYDDKPVELDGIKSNMLDFYTKFYKSVPETNDMMAALICNELKSRLDSCAVDVDVEFGTEDYSSDGMPCWNIRFDLKSIKEDYGLSLVYQDDMLETYVNIIPSGREVFYVRIRHPEWRNVKKFKI
jgi:hypothetical protein